MVGVRDGWGDICQRQESLQSSLHLRPLLVHGTGLGLYCLDLKKNIMMFNNEVIWKSDNNGSSYVIYVCYL